MTNLLLLFTCLLAGVSLRLAGRLADGAHGVINAVIIHVALPALTLRSLHRFEFDVSHGLPVAMPWAVFGLGALLFWVLGRHLGLTRAQIGALTLVGGLGNTSFVGLPMIETLHGRDGLGLGLLIDQLGSYLVLGTLGVIVAAWYADDGRDRPRALQLLRRVATFPPVVALALALLLRPLPMPVPVDGLLARLGDTLAPLALMSVGLQLRLDALREHGRALLLGLGYKLLLAPALVVGVMILADAELAMTTRVTVIEAAMPPMIGAGIVAAQSNLAPRLVSAMLGIGIPLGLLTACGWHLAFGLLAA